MPTYEDEQRALEVIGRYVSAHRDSHDVPELVDNPDPLPEPYMPAYSGHPDRATFLPSPFVALNEAIEDVVADVRENKYIALQNASKRVYDLYVAQREQQAALGAPDANVDRVREAFVQHMTARPQVAPTLSYVNAPSEPEPNVYSSDGQARATRRLLPPRNPGITRGIRRPNVSGIEVNYDEFAAAHTVTTTVPELVARIERDTPREFVHFPDDDGETYIDETHHGARARIGRLTDEIDMRS